ncbi:MAG: DUF1700 domain-containing protein [Clostridia bacterium]|nr:DUF1700 domain-containing protein [Clostridia bacterium]
MTRTAWLNELKGHLSFLPREEANEAMRYYEEYFEDSDLSDEEVIAQLGTPQSVAASFREPDAQQGAQASPHHIPRWPIWVYVLIGVIALPILAPLIIGGAGTLVGAMASAAGVLIAVVTGMFAVFVGLLGGGTAMIAKAVFMMETPANALFAIGLGLLAIGLAISLGALIAVVVVKLIPALIRAIVSFGTKLLERVRKGGNSK